VTDDRYFVLFDRDVVRPNLISATDDTLQAVIGTSNLAELDTSLSAVQQNGVNVANKMGWYINFQESGEKSMATGLIFNSKLIFTSYSPNAGGGSTNCSPVSGQTNQYVFCMPYGKLCTTTGSYKKANVMLGLAGQPQIIVPPNNGDDDPSNDEEIKVLTGTSIEGGIFDPASASKTLQSTKKWREKLGN
jgi:type IV pilus assembly protein PilY1